MKKLVAVIIETRPIEGLETIIQQHMDFLPSGTDLYVFTSEKSFFNPYVLQRKFNVYNFTLEIDSIHDYNKALTIPEFWEQFTEYYDRVLIFQSDSAILRKGIEKFYEWSFIGASWTWNKEHIGNGGFSLRDPKIMKEICEKFHWDGATNEDHWITKNMFESGIGKLAPIEIADKFSVEAKCITGSLACHSIDKWLSPEDCEKIRNQYK